MSNANAAAPLAGVGVGLRHPHHAEILASRPAVPFFEVLLDNYVADGGPPLLILDEVCAAYPASFHSVGMSLGSTDPLRWDYLRRLRRLVERHRPAALSDHLCWISVDGVYHHDLLPLPQTPAVVAHLVERIRAIQDFFGMRLDVENVSGYLRHGQSTMPEHEFVAAVADGADCGILLDINNVYVNRHNLGIDAEAYLRELPDDRVRQFHLGGFEDHGEVLLDSHSRPVAEPVLDLFARAVARFGPRPTVVEWDNDVPSWAELLHERERAAAVHARGGAPA